jgi:hypothetical protein
MRRLVGLYPAAWRARYGDELLELISERPPVARDVIDIVRGAIDAHLSPQLAGPPTRRAAISQRLAGVAAVAGGLVWCAAYLGPGLRQNDEAIGSLVIVAFALMALSLPGTYMARYGRQLAGGGSAAIASLVVVFGGILPWGILLTVPVVALVGILGAGSLALAGARAGLSAPGRWRLLAIGFGVPLTGAIVVSMGLLGFGDSVAPAVAAALPFGAAWIALGARMARGTPPFSGLDGAPS